VIPDHPGLAVACPRGQRRGIGGQFRVAVATPAMTELDRGGHAHSAQSSPSPQQAKVHMPSEQTVV
jgi:hypothetical protein